MMVDDFQAGAILEQDWARMRGTSQNAKYVLFCEESRKKNNLFQTG